MPTKNEESKKATPRLRPNVAGIVQRSDGRILICERINLAGAWQFPQGGVDKGESHAEALAREMEEEIGLRPGHYRVVAHKGPYRYLFGDGREKKGYQGQEQDYYLLQLVAPEAKICLATAHPEFRACRWIEPSGFDLGWLPGFKKEVYQAVLNDFFGILK